MARLTHAETGVVVNVADEKVARFGAEWKREAKAQPKSAAPKSSK